MLFEKEMEERGENSSESWPTRTAIKQPEEGIVRKGRGEVGSRGGVTVEPSNFIEKG